MLADQPFSYTVLNVEKFVAGYMKTINNRDVF